MHYFLIVTALALISITTLNDADARVSVSVGQPGFYGRINIGGFAPPPVLYQQPIAIGRVPMDRAPIYLHVPPSHAKQWKQYCRDYNACGERVLFVQKNWYNREFVPRYQANQRGRQNNHPNGRRNSQGGQHWNAQQQGRGSQR